MVSVEMKPSPSRPSGLPPIVRLRQLVALHDELPRRDQAPVRQEMGRVIARLHIPELEAVIREGRPKFLVADARKLLKRRAKKVVGRKAPPQAPALPLTHLLARYGEKVRRLPTKVLAKYAGGQIPFLKKGEKEIRRDLTAVVRHVLTVRREQIRELRGMALTELRQAARGGPDPSRRIAAGEVYAELLPRTIGRLTDEQLAWLADGEADGKVLAIFAEEKRRRLPRRSGLAAAIAPEHPVTWRTELRGMSVSKLESVIVTPPRHWPPVAVDRAKRSLARVRVFREMETLQLCGIFQGCLRPPSPTHEDDRRFAGLVLAERDPEEVRRRMRDTSMLRPRPPNSLEDIPDDASRPAWTR